MFNGIIAWLARSPLHSFVSKSIVVVEYVGRRSGKALSVPVNYVLIDQGGWQRIWITSQRDRVWWRNFKGGRRADLVLRGKRTPVELVAVTDFNEVAHGLEEYLQAVPNAARYFGVGLDDDGNLTKTMFSELRENA